MRKLILSLSITALAAMTSSAFAHDKSTTLYDKLGGDAGVRAIVIGMLERTNKDPRTAKIMENSNIDRNAKYISEYFCAKTGGPCEYSGQEMHVVHHGLGITTKHFNLLVENLQSAMRDEGIPFSTQGKLLAILAPDHHDIVVRSRKGE